jgi:hypothetical protein
MPDKRMRPVVKEEPGAGGAQQQQQQQHGAAAEGHDGQRRRVEEEAQGGAWLQLQLLRTNADALDQVRAMGEQLLQAKAELAELRAEIRIKDAALEAKDAVLQSKDAVIQAKDIALQAKDIALQAKDIALQGKDALLEAAPSNLHSSPADKRGNFLKFSVERAKVTHESGVVGEFAPSMDGSGDQELLELHVHATKVEVVKVRCCAAYGAALLCRLDSSVALACRAAADVAQQLKQLAGHCREAATMHVSNALYKPLPDTRRCDILHANSASYGRKKNDSYSQGGVKSISVTFKGHRVY